MKILIVGLGLLGGSYAKALKKQGFNVSALDINQESIKYAVEIGIIDFGTTDLKSANISEMDLVIFALYPHTFIEWIQSNQNEFKPGAVITDVTGVKGGVVKEIQSILRDDVEFVSAHPMAGRESSGIEYSDDAIFKQANYIVVPTEENSKEAIELCKDLGRTLGFARIVELSVPEHDRMIAFLSQLTHCIAVSLMCSNDDEKISEYTGDSFRDLTRIAKINDKMWSELFLLNRDALLKEMNIFIETFSNLKSALENEDSETIRQMMRCSTERRQSFDIRSQVQ